MYVRYVFYGVLFAEYNVLLRVPVREKNFEKIVLVN